MGWRRMVVSLAVVNASPLIFLAGAKLTELVRLAGTPVVICLGPFLGLLDLLLLSFRLF